MSPADVADPVPSDARLAAWVKRALSQHPDILLPAGQFATFLTRRVGAALQAREEAALELGDLYLAFAYGQGHERAQERLEQQHFARIERRLSKMATPAAIIAEILQDLRCRLVEFSELRDSGQTYAGRGSLGGWLFVSAVRQAERRLYHARREEPQPHSADQRYDAMLPQPDPEMEHLVQSYRVTFEEAMQHGLAQLTSRQRNLLRLHFLEQLSIDRLAEVYGVHRSTAARWLIRAQDRFAAATRERFVESIPELATSLPRVLALIQSKLNVNLKQMLHAAAESET